MDPATVAKAFRQLVDEQVLVMVTGYGIGFNGPPFLGAVVDVADVPLAGSLPLCLAGLLPGAAATWALVRDMPIRSRIV